jgi:hypothetical protein
MHNNHASMIALASVIDNALGGINTYTGEAAGGMFQSSGALNDLLSASQELCRAVDRLDRLFGHAN